VLSASVPVACDDRSKRKEDGSMILGRERQIPARRSRYEGTGGYPASPRLLVQCRVEWRGPGGNVEMQSRAEK